jgi:hypothetical protein
MKHNAKLIEGPSNHIERLVEAAEIGLEYAEEALEEKKRTFAGYPHRYSLDEYWVNEMKEALRVFKKPT